MKHVKFLALFVVILSLSLSACSGQLSIEDPWTRPALIDGNSAAYMVIVNNTESDEILLGALTTAAEAVELHDVVMMDVSEMEGEETQDSGEMADSNTAMQMVKQEFVQIHAGEAVTFEPGGLHVMLIGMQENLIDGDSITLTLIFQNAGEVVIEVPVETR